MLHFKHQREIWAIAFALPCFVISSSAQSLTLQKKVKNAFLQNLKAQQKELEKGKETFANNKGAWNHLASSTDLQEAVDEKDITSYQQMVWKAWLDANQEFKEEKIISMEDLQKGENSSWTLPNSLEPNAILPYYYGSKKGNMSVQSSDNQHNNTNRQHQGTDFLENDAAPLPLFLYLHGSGPKQQEWETGLKLAHLFKDAPSAYFIPQIPNEGEYYRWWQLSKQYAWEKLLRQVLTSNQVDANRLYVFGISEGGYGSQRLASFYADYWAAAGPMAGGEPLKNAPVENCANIGFSFLTGADDMGFYRNILTHYTQVAFDSAQLAHPLSADGKPLFRHRIHLLPGMQHSIDYRLTTPWLKDFTRNPYPKTVLWEDFEMDGRHRSGFYNLQVLARPSEARTYYDMNIEGNVIRLNISNVEYICTQKDKQWGIEMKFNRSYSNATGGKLRIYLNKQLIDMSQPITIIVNGKPTFEGIVKTNLKDMVTSCAEYFDPCRVYPASVDIDY